MMISSSLVPTNSKIQLASVQQGRCNLCADDILEGEGEVDHIVPQCLTSNHNLHNLQLICSNCHRRKTRHDLRDIARVKQKKKDIMRNLTCLKRTIDSIAGDDTTNRTMLENTMAQLLREPIRLHTGRVIRVEDVMDTSIAMAHESVTEHGCFSSLHNIGTMVYPALDTERLEALCRCRVTESVVHKALALPTILGFKGAAENWYDAHEIAITPVTMLCDLAYSRDCLVLTLADGRPSEVDRIFKKSVVVLDGDTQYILTFGSPLYPIIRRTTPFPCALCKACPGDLYIANTNPMAKKSRLCYVCAQHRDDVVIEVTVDHTVSSCSALAPPKDWDSTGALKVLRGTPEKQGTQCKLCHTGNRTTGFLTTPLGEAKRAMCWYCANLYRRMIRTDKLIPVATKRGSPKTKQGGPIMIFLRGRGYKFKFRKGYCAIRAGSDCQKREGAVVIQGSDVLGEGTYCCSGPQCCRKLASILGCEVKANAN